MTQPDALLPFVCPACGRYMQVHQGIPCEARCPNASCGLIIPRDTVEQLYAATRTASPAPPLDEAQRVEAIARAICAASGLDPDKLDSFHDPNWYEDRRAAEAAIAADPYTALVPELVAALRKVQLLLDRDCMDFQLEVDAILSRAGGGK